MILLTILFTYMGLLHGASIAPELNQNQLRFT